MDGSEKMIACASASLARLRVNRQGVLHGSLSSKATSPLMLGGIGCNVRIVSQISTTVSSSSFSSSPAPALPLLPLAANRDHSRT
jgi:hypothetical protein